MPGDSFAFVVGLDEGTVLLLCGEERASLAPGLCELAGYRIEPLIGRMGAVYRAEESGLGRNVALKVIAGPFDFGAAPSDRAGRGG